STPLNSAFLPAEATYFYCIKDNSGADLSAHITASPNVSPYSIMTASWTDAAVTPPSNGIIHVEVWDSRKAAAAGTGCSATTDPMANDKAPSATGLWSMAEFPTALKWYVSDNFTQKTPGIGRTIGNAPGTP